MDSVSVIQRFVNDWHMTTGKRIEEIVLSKDALLNLACDLEKTFRSYQSSVVDGKFEGPIYLNFAGGRVKITENE